MRVFSCPVGAAPDAPHQEKYQIKVLFLYCNKKAQYMTVKEFDEKWGNVDTDLLNDNDFREFKNDCFNLYEQTGFLELFDSPYDDIGGGMHEHNGMRFEVIRRATEEECDLEAMPLWLVRFENGDEAYCYPEEIALIEHE